MCENIYLRQTFLLDIQQLGVYLTRHYVPVVFKSGEKHKQKPYRTTFYEKFCSKFTKNNEILSI
jgi:hypothetical protein